jgi:uncharacterized protein (TIGR03083 family)
MIRLSYDRYCSEIVTQTRLLRSVVAGADLGVAVPSCPGWSLGQLLRHVGAGHRYAATVVSTRATQSPPDDELRNPVRRSDDTAVSLGDWLVDGAILLADSLREAGPDARMWTAVPDQPVVFWARPQMFDFHPEQRELLGPGRTIHLHANDTAPAAAGEWLVDLTGNLIRWRPGHEKAAVAARGRLTDLLLLIYGRQPVAAGRVEVLGDVKLLDVWLEKVSFG